MAVKEHINEYFNGRAFMTLSALMLIVATAMALSMGIKPVSPMQPGMFFTLEGPLFEPGLASAAINVLCLLATGGIMLAVNKVFTFVRLATHLPAAAFYWLLMAHPQGLVALNAGTLLCLVAAITTLPLFASFQDRHAQRSIFLVFAIIATGTMFHYGFLVLLPVFFLGFLNMGVLNLKGLLAMLFGLITPLWIVLGLGIVSPAHFAMPQFDGIWHLTATPHMGLVHAAAAVIGATGITLALTNLMTIMNYRMQTRVFNGFFVLALVMAMIAMCLNCHSMGDFLPLLSLMVAIQVAHAHTLRTTRPYRFLYILLLMVVCIAFFTATNF